MARLDGVRIAITRSAEDNAEWSERLTSLGAEVVALDYLEFQVCEGNVQGLRLLLPHADWLVFASPRAVRFTRELAGDLDLGGTPAACVGPKTAEAARAAGCRVELVAEDATARGLARELLARTGTDQVALHLAARDGRPELEEAFEAAGGRLASLAVYATEPVSTPPPLPPVHAVLFASPSAVRVAASAGGVPEGTRVLSIGPTTSAALREAGLPVHAEAQTRDLDGLLAVLESSASPGLEHSTEPAGSSHDSSSPPAGPGR